MQGRRYGFRTKGETSMEEFRGEDKPSASCSGGWPDVHILTDTTVNIIKSLNSGRASIDE